MFSPRKEKSLMYFVSCKRQLSLHRHIVSIPEVSCLMRCSVEISSAVPLVDSRADGARRLFSSAADVFVAGAHCS